MIDATAAALLEALIQRGVSTAKYDEESDTITVSPERDVVSRYALPTYRNMIQNGDSVEDVARLMGRIYEEACQLAKSPSLRTEEAIPHLVPVSQYDEMRLVGAKISPDLAVALAFDRPEYVVLPSKERISKAGFDGKALSDQAVSNIVKILEDDPGAEVGEEMPGILIFQGNLAADRAYAFVQGLPEASATFLDQDAAAVSLVVDKQHLLTLAFLANQVLPQLTRLSHPLSPNVYLFTEGEVSGMAFAFSGDED